MLTEKRKRFIEEYLIDANAAAAAVRAGFKAKNPKVAAQVGTELMQIPAIREAIDERLAQMQSERIASAQEVMEYLTSILRGEEIEEVTVIEGKGAGFSEARNYEKSVAPKDKIKAAELLGKRYGLFTDKVDLGASALTVVIEHDYGEPDEDAT